jgi:enamine deaminase RidA (YjgF/YER057c/UK114 family)
MDTNATEQKLAELGFALPVLPTSKGVYKKCLAVGNQLFVSGHISVNTDGSSLTGKLGEDCSDENGVIAARQCGLAMLATLKQELGGFEKIKRVIKILGMVNATPDYKNHPVIINGCSELFRDVWGDENGVGVRSAVGMGSLPGNVAVEIEAIFELHA